MPDYIDPRMLGLGLALALGFLVGLEREWSPQKSIGLRSFTLIGGAGGLSALLAEAWGGWVVAAALLGVAALLTGHHLLHREPSADGEPGTTTLVAAIAIFLVGAASVTGYRAEAIVTAGIVTLVLYWKQPLHGLVDRLGRNDLNAIVRFVLITLVVLPLLPDETFGPYDIFNPFQAWLMVVLIVGLNLVGYVAFRLLSADSGALLGGVLGGLISSTATTVSFAQLTRHNAGLSTTAVLIILLASTVVYARVGVELAVVAPGLLRHAAAPMAVFAVVMLIASAVVFPRVRRQRVELPHQDNPARLKIALSFGALYVVIIFAVAAARDVLGTDAIYAVAAISGLTDVDALTLSVGQLFHRGTVEADVAWRSIFLATLANLLFKIGAGCVLGSAALRRYLLALGGGALAAGVALLLVWP